MLCLIMHFNLFFFFSLLMHTEKKKKKQNLVQAYRYLGLLHKTTAFLQSHDAIKYL